MKTPSLFFERAEEAGDDLFLFYVFIDFKQLWTLQGISMFPIVLCLLMDLKENGKGGFSWGCLKSVLTAVVDLVK